MSDTTQPTNTAGATLVDKIMEKYKYTPEAREQTHRAFDSTARSQADTRTLERMSRAPKTGTGTGDDVYKEMAGIQLDLAELAERYGKLNVNFASLVGKDKVYGLWEALKIKVYETVGKRERAREMKMDAYSRHGNGMEILVDKMSEVLADQHEKAKQGKSLAERLQAENVAHLKRLDKKLVDSLRKSYAGTADYATAEQEVKRLEDELRGIDDALMACEKEVQDAKMRSDLNAVNALTDKMTSVLDIKYGVLDGKLSADGAVSEIRRQLLDKAEALQSVKGATAATKVNYQATMTLIDAMNELEIKYRHAKEDMVPVFKSQAKIATLGMSQKEMRDTLLKVAGISTRLMDANARMVKHLSAQTFELLQTPLYDPEKARAVEEDIRAYREEMNKLKMEWVEAQQSLSIADPHYAKQQ